MVGDPRNDATRPATLLELRQLRAATQGEIAAALGIAQPRVSRMERQTNFIVSTLRDYVAALGGELVLLARFPDAPAVELDLDEAEHD